MLTGNFGNLQLVLLLNFEEILHIYKKEAQFHGTTCTQEGGSGGWIELNP